MSLLSKVGSAIGGAVKGLAKSGAMSALGPVGAAAGAFLGLANKQGTMPRVTPVAALNPFDTQMRTAIGAGMTMLGLGARGGRVSPQNGQCPRGYHLNKHKLADGTPARSVCVRNRSMNPLNGRAAQRAVTRVKRAEKLVRKLRIFRPVRQLAARGGHKPGCGCVACRRR